MTPRQRALAASSPAVLGLLAGLWVHRVAVVDRLCDLAIRALARRPGT